MERVFTFSLIALLLVSTVAFGIHLHSSISSEEEKPFYFGVTFCGNTASDARMLIDRVKAYTNLFVLQSGPISKNETAVNEICDYAVESGLYIIVYFGWFDTDCPWQIPWLNFAKERWADRFLGVYYYDEPGGIQIDYDWAYFFNRIIIRNSPFFQSLIPVIEEYLNGTLPRDYDAAANRYIDSIRNDRGLNELKNSSIVTFVSDYALYWFDYLGGWDVILAHFGWNCTIEQEIALVRGAARMQNKKWGAIITWRYNNPPYLDSGEAIYDQMRAAYEAGAEYVVVFNYAEDMDGPSGTLQEDHFIHLERFWNEVVQSPAVERGSVEAEAVLVLPENYGWGMRRPDDRIWYWESDENSTQIWDLSRKLLSDYGYKLDIIYEDPDFPVTNQYKEIYYWNDLL